MRSRAACLVSVLLAAGLIAACGGEDDEEPEVELPAGCEQVEDPAPKEVDLSKPRKLAPPPRGTFASVETSCGSFDIALDTAVSPETTASFAYLVRKGVYDGTAFHRIVPDFVIQGGDPLGDGTGGPGYSIDERPPNDTDYTQGTVAMAKTEVEPPGRSGSQFFVVVAADAGLPADFALLGEVGSGRGVTERIAEAGDPASGQGGEPRAPVVIQHITLERG
ncbi:MAG TPA: peptidylprolyl isomerase [Solirubrobacterales bacterium]|jgi:cyclophilin family peptidyl-prolyl cis-trans isomerase|nr:peptidylprolyl isomerase [Solirubrobacterales bacterium]